MAPMRAGLLHSISGQIRRAATPKRWSNCSNPCSRRRRPEREVLVAPPTINANLPFTSGLPVIHDAKCRSCSGDRALWPSENCAINRSSCGLPSACAGALTLGTGVLTLRLIFMVQLYLCKYNMSIFVAQNEHSNGNPVAIGDPKIFLPNNAQMGPDIYNNKSPRKTPPATQLERIACLFKLLHYSLEYQSVFTTRVDQFSTWAASEPKRCTTLNSP